ncbi:hypothetical protein [Bdellovibrio sp. HCB-162]|uniref:hypothetical protein n=1 Tax=Bdellovibrio sp. HCB-162 TaxID=3394234 RepID=UPI0039BCE9AB
MLALSGTVVRAEESKAKEVKRISSIYKDLGESQKIYLHAGLISVLEFPRDIVEVRIGNPKSIKAQLSQVSPKELTLYLTQNFVEPTNIIVKSDKRFYVFDVIPSKVSHQDYIKVSGAFGGPQMAQHGRVIESRALTPNVVEKIDGKLIERFKLGGEE